jgi:outer membrane receptor protein involved in Fe transport
MNTPVFDSLGCRRLGRRLMALALLLGVVLPVAGQGGPANNRPAGKVSGVVVDAVTNAPVEYATVALLSPRDSSLVTGTVTNPQGQFLLEPVPAGAYRVRITYIGYRNAVKENLVVRPDAPVVDLGSIKIRPSSQALEEVVVTAEKPLFEQSIDKRVFNVEKSIVSEGGSATDILETIPSVSVDVEGNVSLRGSGNVTILIDGKPSGLTGADRAAVLQQIPAASIERIEVVTNPSARYDAEGMSGIINVVLKKNQRSGFNGTASASAGTRHKYNGSLNLSYRTPKFNAYTNYSYRYNTRYGRGFSLRELAASDSARQQNSSGNEVDNNHLFGAGIDYFAGPKTTLGLSGVFRTNAERADETTINREYVGAGQLGNLFYQLNDTRESGGNADLNLDFKRTFAKPEQSLSASMRYSYDSDDDSDLLTSRAYLDEFTPAGAPDAQRYNFEDLDNHVLVSQLDYAAPLPGERTLEAGYKSIVRNIDNTFLFQDYLPEAGAFVDNPALSNRFFFNEQVHSLYGSLGGTIKKFGYQAGLRAEGTLSRSEQKTTQGTFRNDYLNLFPSVFLSYQLEEEQQLQLNYSRRINRPGMRELNPFVNYSDTLNLRQGNPRLNPELTHALEVSYQRNWKTLYVTTSVFYRMTSNVISRIVELVDSASNVTLSTPQNLNNRNAVGVELITRGSLTRWWNITSSFNLFRSAVNGTNLRDDLGNVNLTWSLSLLSNMNIPKVVQVQLSANYRGPEADAQGLRRSFYGINVGLRRDLFRDRASLSLNVTDIFDTREFRSEIITREFTETRNRKRETRIGTLTFTYRFGKQGDTDRRNRQKGDDDDGPGGGDEDSF